jgi:hypothetical protein
LERSISTTGPAGPRSTIERATVRASAAVRDRGRGLPLRATTEWDMTATIDD